MNRRGFLRALGVGCAAVYLRLAPEKINPVRILAGFDPGFVTVRRTVFYYYPKDNAPLVGLLTLLKDDVDHDKPIKWYEIRR